MHNVLGETHESGREVFGKTKGRRSRRERMRNQADSILHLGAILRLEVRFLFTVKLTFFFLRIGLCPAPVNTEWSITIFQEDFLNCLILLLYP